MLNGRDQNFSTMTQPKHTFTMRSTMQLSLLLFILCALFYKRVDACPLHVRDDSNRPMNNQRRSPTPNSSNCSTTAIENVSVFNGSHFETNQTVCFQSGYIVAACPNRTVTVDGRGKYLIPGLFDNHLHLTDVQSLENMTSYGITTAMHMNCQNYTQCAINAEQIGLTSFIYAGMSAVGNGSSHEATDPTRPKDTLIYPDTDVDQFVAWQFGNGSDFHKITAEVNGPSTQQQIDMVQTAHCQFAKQTMTHASAVESYYQAVESLTDGIQHVPDDGLLDSDLIQRIKAQGQFVTPTLNVFEYAYNDPTLQQYFQVTPGSNRSLSHAECNARMLYEAGVPLITGTDSVGTLVQEGNAVEVPFGLTLHYELQHFVQIIGMSPAEAINAATREAAKWHRLPDRGSIEVGKRADLLLLNADPLANITNTLDIDQVWVNGLSFFN